MKIYTYRFVCLLFICSIIGCSRRVIYEVASISRIDDLNKEYSVEMAGPYDYQFKFKMEKTNREAFAADAVSISVINRNEHQMKFHVYSNNYVNYITLATNSTVEIFRGPLVQTNTASRMTILYDDSYTFKFAFKEGSPSLPIKIRFGRLGK